MPAPASGGGRRGHPPVLRGRRPLRRGHRGGHHQRQRPGRHGRLAAGPGGYRERPPITWPGGCSRECAGPPGSTGCRWSAATSPSPTGHPALSAFGLGRADRPLSARYAAPGQTLVVACCLEGQMRADYPFFPSFDERGERLAGDVRLLAEAASPRLGGGGQGCQHGRAGRVAGDAAGVQPARGAPRPGRAAGPGRGGPGALDHAASPVTRSCCASRGRARPSACGPSPGAGWPPR